MTIEGPAPSGQTDRVRTQQVLCGVAMLLFVGFLWTRSLDWSILEYGYVKVEGSEGFGLDTTKVPFEGNQWSLLNDVIWILAALLALPNLAYIFIHPHVDQLVPALANTAVGAVLTALAGYFILTTADAIGIGSNLGKNSVWIWTLDNGVYPALAFALGILGVGIAQGVLRPGASRQPNVHDTEIPSDPP